MNSANDLANWALAFVSAFASTLVIAAIGRYIAGSFTTDRGSRIAAFGLAIGYALGRFSYSGPATVEKSPALGMSLGAAAALVATWAWLLRKRVDAEDD